MQALTDVSVVLWIVLWVVVGRAVHTAISAFAAAGRQVESGAGGIGSNLDTAGDRVAKLPVVGDAVRAPLRSAGDAARQIAAAGHGLDERATWLAVVLAFAVAVPPALAVGVPWLLLRLRFARRAGAAVALGRTPEGQRLLALRALSTRPLPRLARIAPDPVEAWRRDEPQVVARLAALELRASGVRVPRPGSTG